MKHIWLPLLLAPVAIILGRDALGDGVALFSTSKSLPEATVAVIDPESGTSSGGEGGDVRLAEGDIILFQFQFTPVPDKVNRGLQSYMTDYIPDGTEVVGVRFIDTDNRTIKPRYPGLAIDGCSGGSNCTNFNDLPCTSGANCSAGLVDLAGGSISQLHADTGIFFANDPRLAKVPSDDFLSTEGGAIAMIEPQAIDPELTPLLEIDPGPYFAHNHWDYDQVLAFGTATAVTGNSGKGNAPYLYGSPVAGPHSYYRYEATEVGAAPTTNDLEFNDVVGPWQRIKYPGSLVGFGDCVSTNRITCTPEADGAEDRQVIPAALATHCGASGTESCEGTDVTPAVPANANAVRFALGESRTGIPGRAEIALRVKPGGVPIDSLFGGTGGNVNCMETTGANIARRDTGNRGDDNMWGSYIGSPACVFLRLLLDLEADTGLAVGGGAFEDVNYTLRLKNLSVAPETNVILRQRWDSSRGTYVATTSGPAPTGPAPCPAPDAGLSCLTWNLGTMNPSDEVTIQTHFTAGGAGGGTLVMEAQYTSSELPTTDFRTRDVTVIKPIALPDIQLAPAWDPLTAFIPGGGSGTATFTGTVANNGTQSFTYDEINFVLPSGWSISGDQINVGGTNLPCAPAGSSTPVCDAGALSSFAPGDSLAITVTFDVPATATDLYDFDLQFWGSQPAFGGGFETYIPEAGTINVGAVRTAPPVIDCPISSTATSVSGTSENNADIELRFNLMPRGLDTADGTGDWEVTNFDAFGPFGDMYGGLEVTATATAPGKLESEPSEACDVTATRECSDGIDNPEPGFPTGDGLIDFPADPGCDSPFDNSEADEVPQCSNGIDDEPDGDIDFPDDLGCYAADDPVEDLNPACSDGIDNDGDGLIDDGEDPDCTGPNDRDEVGRPQCSDGIDNDGDGDTDFPDDEFCNSAFDDDEFDISLPTDIKARLLIVFDTSGSMNYNTCDPVFTGGDGSTECPGSDVLCADCGSADCGNGLPDDSRMAIVKTGINNVIAGFGEVEYGLMRFHQRAEQFDIPDDCPGPNAGLQSGGWQGGGLEPCGGGFNAGDLLVGFGFDNHTDLIGYMDGQSNYPGDPPAGLDWELRGSGSTPLGGSLDSALTVLTDEVGGDPASGCRPYRVILVTDGAETCGGDPDGAAAALLAAGFPVHVIGFATTDAGIIASLDSIASNGGTGSAIIASDAAALSAAMADIIDDTLLVEVCNGEDDDCDCPGDTNGDSIVCGPGDVGVDEDFIPPLGDTCDNGELGICFMTGTYVCTADETGVECNAPSGTPQTEICDGLDNNCNGLVDEGFPVGCGCTPTPEVCNGTDDDCDGITDEDTVAEPLPGLCTDCCGVDIGECTFGDIVCNAGTLECSGGTGPTADVCNGLDDDCDTLTDEFTEPCYDFGSGCDLTAGTCDGLCRIGLRGCLEPGDTGYPGIGECIGDVGPAAELCNGLDDDCDTNIDNGFDVGDACDNGQMGACLVMGTKQCLADGSDTFCTAFPVTPGTEVCNCLDDDCDGMTDEDLGPPIGSACGGGTACTGGTLECDPVTCAPSCEGAVGGEAEICNAIDDDCDSLIDEDVPGEGEDCTDPGFESIGDTGECEFGVTMCIGGMIVCVDYEGPRPETCNGVDDNCDGMVDNEAICPSPEDICVEAQCISPCELGEFPCPFGFICRTFPEGDFCVEDPCLDVMCPTGELCNSDDGSCENPCDTITCPGPGQTCFLGGCFDCFDTGYECAETELCVVDDGTGTGICIDNLCLDVECGDDQFCDVQTGDCVDLVCEPECMDGERCDEGACVPDPCAGVDCPSGLICNPDSGRCIADPCAGVTCPRGEACHPSTGECASDPCIGVNCPEGFECRVDFDDEAECAPPPPDTDEGDKIFAAGSGCACDIGSERTPADGALFLLLGVLLLRRKRRER